MLHSGRLRLAVAGNFVLFALHSCLRWFKQVTLVNTKIQENIALCNFRQLSFSCDAINKAIKLDNFAIFLNYLFCRPFLINEMTSSRHEGKSTYNQRVKVQNCHTLFWKYLYCLRGLWTFFVQWSSKIF